MLDNEYIKFTKNGKSVLIGGMSDYPYYEFYTPDDDVPSRTLWEEFAFVIFRKKSLIRSDYSADERQLNLSSVSVTADD